MSFEVVFVTKLKVRKLTIGVKGHYRRTTNSGTPDKVGFPMS